jgi:YcxB-like protein
MVVEGTIEERDYIASQYLHLRPRPVFAVIGLLLLALFVWALAAAPSIIMFGVLVYLVSAYALYIPWSAKRNYRQYKALSTPVSMEIRTDGLYFKQQNGEGLVPWSHVHKWRHNKKMLLLYPTGNVFHLVPSHFFPSQESFGTFVATVKEHVGNAS